jgi:glutaredoxin
MATDYYVPWTCPHCGFHNSTLESVTGTSGRVLAWCDSESGGCDKQVVVDISIYVKGKALKIEEPEAE